MPGNPRTFYATANQTYSAKQTAILANQATPLVTFTTTKVTLDYSGTIHHGSPNFGWYPFTKPTMEMFAGTHTFLLDSGKPNARQVKLDISGCEFNYSFMPTRTPSSAAQGFYLRASGPNNNPSTLYIDITLPTTGTAKYKDSTSVNFNGGNSWKEIGTWSATAPILTDGEMTTLNDLDVWLGLKNSDDQGTRFDVRAELYKNGTLIASGETHCIQGITRNANNAVESLIQVVPFSAQTCNGTTMRCHYSSAHSHYSGCKSKE